jgi:hypothetical protein
MLVSTGISQVIVRSWVWKVWRVDLCLLAVLSYCSGAQSWVSRELLPFGYPLPTVRQLFCKFVN